MNSSRQLLTVAVAVPLALCAIGRVNAQAQSSRSTQSQGYPLKFHDSSDAQVSQHVRRAQAQTLSTTDVATFQAALQTLVNWLSQTATHNPNQQAQINDLQAQINSLTSDQMTQLASNFDVAAFNTAVTTLTQSTTAQPTTRNIPTKDPPSDLVPPPYGICAPTAGPPPVPSDPGTIRGLLIAVEVAHAASIVADKACDTIVEILGEGTNIAQEIIAQVIDLIEFGLETAKDQLEFCDPNAQAAEVTAAWQNSIVIDTDIANLAHDTGSNFTVVENQLTAVNTDIDNHISSVAGNTSTQFTQINNQLTTIATNLTNQTTAIDVDIDSHIAAIDVDLNNHLTSVDADIKNAITASSTSIGNQITQVDSDVLNQGTKINTNISTFQTLDVRLQIEEALSRDVAIGLFELPLADGGYLETVRAIVSDTISKLLAAGQSVGTATALLAKGDTDFAAKLFKVAYQDYAAAYQMAVK